MSSFSFHLTWTRTANPSAQRVLLGKCRRQCGSWSGSFASESWACCGRNIAYLLSQENDVLISMPKIYEIFVERYALRTKGKRRKKARNRQDADVYLSATLTANDCALFLARCMPSAVEAAKRPAAIY